MYIEQTKEMIVTQCSSVRLCIVLCLKNKKVFVNVRMRVCVHIGNDHISKMYISVRSACYNTHKCIRQKTDSD